MCDPGGVAHPGTPERPVKTGRQATERRPAPSWLSLGPGAACALPVTTFQPNVTLVAPLCHAPQLAGWDRQREPEATPAGSPS